LYRGHHRRPRQLSDHRGGGADRRKRRSLLLVLCEERQGGHRLHTDPSRAGAAFARSTRGRGREGLMAMAQRLPLVIFALLMAAIPLIPWLAPVLSRLS